MVEYDKKMLRTVEQALILTVADIERVTEEIADLFHANSDIGADFEQKKKLIKEYNRLINSYDSLIELKYKIIGVN